MFSAHQRAKEIREAAREVLLSAVRLENEIYARLIDNLRTSTKNSRFELELTLLLWRDAMQERIAASTILHNLVIEHSYEVIRKPDFVSGPQGDAS